MSRIGRKPIAIPQGVQVALEGNVVTVKGSKGELSQVVHPDMKVVIEENTIIVERPSDEKKHRSLHGLTRTLVANMVEGVTKGFTKSLEITGVGYRAAKQGKNLLLTIGYSHPVEIEPLTGIEFEVPAPTKITVKGIDKQAVGQMAAEIRAVREPEPYKGKGIRYEKEVIRRKAGKAGKAGKK
ncbi:LSU ribosomal protein L6P [Hydrogenispora ethanolica]|uniref:Large ribosomal subunit protein uL6 n=1 Tax=Hydrogenispora ethanolica TaxID=1082276 RepID=A0A4R1RJY0_HYDET|nr:50S ribosomal protein L6 [Hydrogenispora ethanolica]TCL66474.1 LSU ribosomal protein L6P [Hydrogenispora ethanolica]